LYIWEKAWDGEISNDDADITAFSAIHRSLSFVGFKIPAMVCNTCIPQVLDFVKLMVRLTVISEHPPPKSAVACE